MHNHLASYNQVNTNFTTEEIKDDMIAFLKNNNNLYPRNLSSLNRYKVNLYLPRWLQFYKHFIYPFLKLSSKGRWWRILRSVGKNTQIQDLLQHVNNLNEHACCIKQIPFCFKIHNFTLKHNDCNYNHKCQLHNFHYVNKLDNFSKHCELKCFQRKLNIRCLK